MTDQRVKTDTNGSVTTEPSSVPDNENSADLSEETSLRATTGSRALAGTDRTEKLSVESVSENLKAKRTKSGLHEIDASNATIPIDLNSIPSSRVRAEEHRLEVTKTVDGVSQDQPDWAQGLLDDDALPAETRTIDESSSSNALEVSSDQIDVTSLPQSTQSLIANVEMETPSEAQIRNESQSNLRPLLGSFILLGGFGTQRSGTFEFEHVLEVRKIAAPRRGLLRRGLFLERDKKYSELFFEEAEVARQIVHPNVARVYHVGRQHSFPYLVREHVPGMTLAEHLLSGSRTVIPPSQFAAVFLQVFEGLQAVHGLSGPSGNPLGLVHAAINPNSILLGSTGRVRITEPVFSKFEGRRLSAQEITRQQISDYQAPEQQDAQAVTAMGDWYSMALTIVEFLGGPAVMKSIVSNRSLDSVKSALNGIPIVSQNEKLFASLKGLILEPPEQRLGWVQQLRETLEDELKDAKPHHLVVKMLRATSIEPEDDAPKDITQPMRKQDVSEGLESQEASSGEISFRRTRTELLEPVQEVERKSKLIIPAYLMIGLGLLGALLGMFLLNWIMD